MVVPGSFAWKLALVLVSSVKTHALAPAIFHAPTVCARCQCCMQIFPGDDPLDFIRRAARSKAAEHMAMEEAEGNPKSPAFQKAYADALEEVEVQEHLDRLAGRRSTGLLEDDAQLDNTKVALPQDVEDSAPTPQGIRETVLDEITAAGGVVADNEEQQEVYFALPDGLQSALASGSLANVRLALALMSVDEVTHYRQRCVSVGMWPASDR